MENKRVTSIEALRVASMFLIVVMHYIFCGLKLNPIHMYYDLSSIGGIVDYLSMEPLYILSGTAVNCYVMITGYFLIDKLGYRWNGILKTWFLAFFYSLIFLGLAFSFKIDITKSDILQALFPVHQGAYWFVTSYIGLLLFAPILSRAAVSLSKRSYQIVLVALFFVVFEFFYGKVYGGFRTIIFFGYLFLLAGYLRLHGIPRLVLKYKFIIFLAIWLGLFAMATAINVVGGKFQLVSSAYDGPILFLSFIIFVIFQTGEKEKISWVWLSQLAPYTFGVYLIHTNTFVNDRIWKLLPNTYNYPIIIHCILFCALLFIICVGIDFIRERIFAVLKIDELLKKLSSKLPQL